MGGSLKKVKRRHNAKHNVAAVCSTELKSAWKPYSPTNLSRNIILILTDDALRVKRNVLKENVRLFTGYYISTHV